MNRLRRLLGEIRKRSLWQVLASYAFGSWIILQIAETLSSLIGLPLWFGQAVLLVLLPGLPVVLVTAALQHTRASDAAEPKPASWSRRLFTWQNAMVAGVLAFASLGVGTTGYLGARAAGIGTFGTLLARGDLQEADRVILAEFESIAGDATLSATVTQILRVDLQQSPSIALVESSVILNALRRMGLEAETALTEDRASEVAIREGIKAVIAGEISVVGGDYVLSARLLTPSNGRVLIAVRATSSAAEGFVSAVDDLSARLRERIGESLRSINGNPPLERVTTASLQALEKYALALRANDQGEYARARALLQEAVREDSLFAMAHRKLGVILANRGRPDAEVHPPFERAYRLRERLTDRERLTAIGSYHFWVSGDFEAAAVAYENLLERYPTDPTGLHNLATIHVAGGRTERATGLFLRAIDAGNAGAITYQGAARLLAARGETDGALSLIAQANDRFNTSAFTASLQIGLYVERGDYAAANEVASAWLEQSSDDSFAGMDIGALSLAQGRVAEGLGHIRASFSPDWGDSEESWQWWWSSRVDLLFRDDASALLRYDERLLPLSEEEALEVAADLAWAGYPGVATRLLAASEPDSLQSMLWSLHRARGAIAVAEGRHDDAIAAFQAAEDVVGEAICAEEVRFDRARAYDRVQNADSAIALYELYLTPSTGWRLSCGGWASDWRAYLRLAELYEGRSDIATAVEYYRRFVELWKDADPEFQPRVQSAREAIARLSAN